MLALEVVQGLLRPGDFDGGMYAEKTENLLEETHEPSLTQDIADVKSLIEVACSRA